MFWTKESPTKLMSKRVIGALGSRFNDHELVKLARLATLVDVSAGTELTTQGAVGREAFVIVSGSASVVRDGQKVATLAPGDVVGEIALISGEPRSATVVADGPVTVYALTPREFSTFLTQCPRLENQIAATAVRRLSAA